MEIVFQKVGDGKGRPSKFYKLEDGTLIHWKEYEAKHGKAVEESIKRVECPECPHIKGDSHCATTESGECHVNANTTEVLVEKLDKKVKLTQIEGTYATTTRAGTPVNIVKTLGETSSGIDDLLVIVPSRNSRTTAKASDLFRPECEMIEEISNLKFIGEI